MAEGFKAGKYLKMVLGLLIIVAGLYTYTFTSIGGYPWWQDLFVLIKGGLGLVFIGIGLIIGAIGLTD